MFANRYKIIEVQRSHRDYGTGTWTGGDPACGHRPTRRGGDICPHCGATWHDPQYGLEATFDEYLEYLLGVFNQLKRVLHPAGTCWLNLGVRHEVA